MRNSLAVQRKTTLFHHYKQFAQSEADPSSSESEEQVKKVTYDYALKSTSS